METIRMPTRQEALYNTAHGTIAGYWENNWGVALGKEWIRGLKPNSKILELGCGNGALCELLAVQGHDVTGLDLVQGRGDYDRSKYKFVIHDLQSGYLPFEDNMFDSCVSFDVLEHLEEKWVGQVLFDMFRVANEVCLSVACFYREPFHQTVQGEVWWIKKLKEAWPCAAMSHKGRIVRSYVTITDKKGEESRVLFHCKKEEGK